jgi:hypothetical protein
MAADDKSAVGANGVLESAALAGAAASRSGTITGSRHNRDRAGVDSCADAGDRHADAFGARVQLQLLRPRLSDELDGTGDCSELFCGPAIRGRCMRRVQYQSRNGAGGGNRTQLGRFDGTDSAAGKRTGRSGATRRDSTWYAQFFDIRATSTVCELRLRLIVFIYGKIDHGPSWRERGKSRSPLYHLT